MDATDLPAALADDLEVAFPELVRSLQRGVYSGALRMVGNRHDAEEIAQEAFVRAYRALRRYPAERIRTLRLEPWVWTIAANLCRNLHRTRSRRPRTEEMTHDAAASGPGPEQSALDDTIDPRLSVALARLAWPQRAAVVLHHVVGLSYEEVALALDRPLGTVKADIHRGLTRLRSALLEVAP